jgi:hypothetical protein
MVAQERNPYRAVGVDKAVPFSFRRGFSVVAAIRGQAPLAPFLGRGRERERGRGRFSRTIARDESKRSVPALPLWRPSEVGRFAYGGDEAGECFGVSALSAYRHALAD